MPETPTPSGNREEAQLPAPATPESGATGSTSATKMPETPTPSGNREEAQPPAPAAPESGATGSTSATTDRYGLIGAAIFWLILLGGLGYWWLVPHNRAQVFLETSPKQPFHISGVVLFKGMPVSTGTVYVTFDDPKKNRYLGGTILQVSEGGTFTTSGHELGVPLDSNKESQEPLRVAATFSGQQQGEKKDQAPITTTGKTTLYLNYPPPAGKLTTWGFGLITVVLAIFLITLFTGDLTRRKARILFSITYIMTFMSLAVPIGAIIMVSKSQYAIEMMEEAPVGLIKGTARGVQRPQWLVNLGGAVLPAVREAPTEREAAPPKGAVGDQPPVGASALVSPSPAQQQLPVTQEKPVLVSPSPARQQPPPTQENVRADELRPTPGFAMVQGGLAVPFYVIILAMLGAGINMTKKVPDIQKRHDIHRLPPDTQSMVAVALKAPVAPFVASETHVKTPEEIITVSAIRKELIDNYMGLISAPFLAIAVYYLLQIIATNIAEPVLVLVAFATGFISDSIVTVITTFASEMISKRREKKNEQSESEEKH